MQRMKLKLCEALVEYAPSLERRRLQNRALAESTTSEPELRVLAALGAPHHLLIDIGANDGVYTAFLAATVAEVHVFEPVPQLAWRLGKLFPDATIHEMALSDSPGAATLRIPIIDGRAVFTRSSVEILDQAKLELEIDVSLSTLDLLAPPGRLIVKIDVEGHEMQVVHGGAQCLVDRADAVLVESEERHAAGAPQAMIDWFHEHGFAGWLMLGSQLIPAAEFDLAVHQSAEATAAVAGGATRTAEYGNNFLFVPQSKRSAALLPLTEAGFAVR